MRRPIQSERGRGVVTKSNTSPEHVTKSPEIEHGPLIARLRAKPTVASHDKALRNPDGPKAADAIEALTARVDELQGLLVTSDICLERIKRQRDEARTALRPFSDFAVNVDEVGWTSNIHRERISDWFGPSDFLIARAPAATNPSPTEKT